MITEALLEMYFFQAMVSLFKKKYGANFLGVLKPSSQQEAWIGFDQGWARTKLTTYELFSKLRQSIQGSLTTVSHFYFGFFIQYKVVKRMVRRSTNMPESYTTPYLRVELSLWPNQTTGLSQHETLLRMSRIKGASVYYACPMLFDISQIWRKPRIKQVRFIDIRRSPVGWDTSERHFITFQHKNDRLPLWHSHPVETRALSAEEWINPHWETSPRQMSGEQIMGLLSEAVRAIYEAETGVFPGSSDQEDIVTRTLPPSFTLLQFS